MERTYSFKQGQKVRTIDEDDGSIVTGEVIDTTSNSIFVKWEDMNEPVQHFQDEYHRITLVRALSK